MSDAIFRVQSYFDGCVYHDRGPYSITARSGIIGKIERGDKTDTCAGTAKIHRCGFLMPGLVEAHCHLFLDGMELDFQKRRDYLSASWDEMAAVGKRSVQDSLSAGVTLIRDGGDKHGINHHLRDAANESRDMAPVIRSAGTAIRKEGRYGGFLGIAVKNADDAVGAIHRIAETADELKILLTGIIDFEKGRVKGPVQFDIEALSLMVGTASNVGLRTFAHCSGVDGLQIAVKAGVSSIEHGFLMNRDFLSRMADKQIAWVPTVSPVHFQYERPDLAGWNEQTLERLDDILKNHLEHIALAFDMGVPVIAGSDAGSYGVPHGKGIVDELFFFHRAGISLEETLSSATSVPPATWGCKPADIAPGNRIDFLALEGSPFADIEFLRRPGSIFRGPDMLSIAESGLTRS